MAKNPKNIALFIDGTWNQSAGHSDESGPTNVVKLCDAVNESSSQKKFYLAGVGADQDTEDTDTSFSATKIPPKYWGGLTGYGTAKRIRAAYQFLSANYDPGDKVFLFGFSRGAFAVRSLAGFAERVGLLLKSKAGEKGYVEAAYLLYEQGRDKWQSALREFLREMVGRDQPGPEGTTLPVHFMGVWDTVGALGLPGRLQIFSAPFTEHHQIELPSNVAHARHALSLHDLRRDYEPLLWTIRSHPQQTLVQQWFAGAHSDVGGGYGARETNWSDIALGWIANEASKASLEINRAFSDACSDPRVRLHQEDEGANRVIRKGVRHVLKNWWRLGRATHESFEVHESVIDRLLDRKRESYEAHPQLLEKVDGVSLQMAFEINRRNGTSKFSSLISPKIFREFVETDRVEEAYKLVRGYLHDARRGSIELNDFDRTYLPASVFLILRNGHEELIEIVNLIAEINAAHPDLPLFSYLREFLGRPSGMRS